jgi:hypothetical protein
MRRCNVLQKLRLSCCIRFIRPLEQRCLKPRYFPQCPEHRRGYSLITEGSRLGLAIANDSNQSGNYTIRVYDATGNMDRRII